MPFIVCRATIALVLVRIDDIIQSFTRGRRFHGRESHRSVAEGAFCPCLPEIRKRRLVMRRRTHQATKLLTIP